MATKVALAGATGNLGPAVLAALLEAGFNVTVLSRKGSNTTDSLPKHDNQTIIKVDYADVKGLTDALQSIEVVVSTLTATALDTHKPLIDAAVAAGVKRFLPSEFGSNLENPANAALPVFAGKVAVRKYLEEVTASNPNFTYTYIVNNAFFDWGLKVGFIINVKEHKARLYDGGEHPFSLTTLSTIGKAVAGVIKNQDATENRTVFIHDTALSQKQLMEVVKSIDGKDWQTEVASTKEISDGAYKQLQTSGVGDGSVFMRFIFQAAFGKDSGADYTGRVDNKLLGLPVWNEDQVKEAVEACL